MHRFTIAIACCMLAANPAAAMEVDLDLSQFTAVWSFDDTSPLTDNTGHGHTLINPGGGASPSFGATPGSANLWNPVMLQRSLVAPYVPSGSPGPYVPGPANQVATFASNDYLSVPNSVYSGGSFTTVIAVRDSVAGGGFDTILASSRFRFQSINETIGGAINSPGGSFGGPASTVNVNDWNLIALRYDDTTRVLNTYNITNTDALGLPVIGSANAPGLGNQTNFRIGGDGTSLIGGFDGFAGQLDFVIFQDGYLDDTQLQQISSFFSFGPTVPVALAPEPESWMLGVFVVLIFAAGGWYRRRRAAA